MTAFRATFSDMKLVKTRQVAQLIFEIPIEEFDAAYEVLGGMPVPAKERWFGIAAINPQAEKETQKLLPHTSPATASLETGKPKRDWREVQPAQQAGIRCAEPTFIAFLKETRADDWHESQDAAECVRLICGISSRSELGVNHKARVIWTQLDAAYQAWKALEHA
jgi:hypothetical protein